MSDGSEYTLPRWFDGSIPGPPPGVYYSESCDECGNPLPGLTLVEAGAMEWTPPPTPTKYFGPIPGAFKP